LHHCSKTLVRKINDKLFGTCLQNERGIIIKFCGITEELAYIWMLQGSPYLHLPPNTLYI
jgi:hypothetical protein